MPDPLRPLQEYHERRIAAKHALYLLHGHGCLRRAADDLQLNYQVLRHVLAGRGKSEPMLKKIEEYLGNFGI